jgi:hypothetical protein
MIGSVRLGCLEESLSHGVRCPNYYLAGDTASQYPMEGTDTFEDVRWRLIWKDSRYASGGTAAPHQRPSAPSPGPPERV